MQFTADVTGRFLMEEEESGTEMGYVVINSP